MKYLADLKAELIDGQRVAVDEDGKVLVWVGEQPVVRREKEDRQRSPVTNPRSLLPDLQPPVSYPPAHLAERIRAEQAASRTTQHETRIMLTEGHHLLSKVYHWFTEGFDTKDLQESKALLAELT